MDGTETLSQETGHREVLPTSHTGSLGLGCAAGTKPSEDLVPGCLPASLPPSLPAALPPPPPTHLHFTRSSSVGLKPIRSQNRCRSPGSYRSGVGLGRTRTPNRLPGADPQATLSELAPSHIPHPARPRPWALAEAGSTRRSGRVLWRRHSALVSWGCGPSPGDLQEAEALAMPLAQVTAPGHREAPPQSRGHTEPRAFTVLGLLEVPSAGSWASSVRGNLLGMRVLRPRPRRPESGVLQVGPAFWGLTGPVNRHRPSQQAVAAEQLPRQSSTPEFSPCGRLQRPGAGLSWSSEHEAHSLSRPAVPCTGDLVIPPWFPLGLSVCLRSPHWPLRPPPGTDLHRKSPRSLQTKPSIGPELLICSQFWFIPGYLSCFYKLSCLPAGSQEAPCCP